MPGQRLPSNATDMRSQILNAALEVIASVGVHRTTHRRIAFAARVSPGSLTYHFKNLDSIIESAFDFMSTSMSNYYKMKLSESTDIQDAIDSVVDIICDRKYADPRRMALLFEMYSYANHNDKVSEISREWLAHSRKSLLLHFSPEAAEALDVLIEGWPMHRAFHGEELDRALVHGVVSAIVESRPARTACPEHPNAYSPGVESRDSL